MPFKSKAQRRKFAELLVKGEISEATFEEWNRETGSKKLPEYVDSRARRGSQAKKNSKPASRAVRRPMARGKTKSKSISKSGRKRK